DVGHEDCLRRAGRGEFARSSEVEEMGARGGPWASANGGGDANLRRIHPKRAEEGHEESGCPSSIPQGWAAGKRAPAFPALRQKAPGVRICVGEQLVAELRLRGRKIRPRKARPDWSADLRPELEFAESWVQAEA